METRHPDNEMSTDQKNGINLVLKVSILVQLCSNFTFSFNFTQIEVIRSPEKSVFKFQNINWFSKLFEVKPFTTSYSVQ